MVSSVEVVIHGQRRYHRAEVGGDEGPLEVSRLAAGDDAPQLDDLFGIFAGGGIAAHRLEAVLDRRIEARQGEIAGWGILCQGGNGEDIVAGHLIHQVGDASDIVRVRTTLGAGNRVYDERGGAAGDDHRPVVGQSAVKFRVAPVERELGGEDLAKLFHHVAREADDLTIGVQLAAVLP